MAAAALPLSLSPILVAHLLGLLAGALLLALLVVDTARARPLRHPLRAPVLFRLDVAILTVLQPLARTLGRLTAAADTAGVGAPQAPMPGPAERRPGGTLLLPLRGLRAELMRTLMGHLRAGGLHVLPPTGWEDYDFRVIGSSLVTGDVVSSGHVDGFVQLRVRLRLRMIPALVTAGLVAILLLLAPVAIGVVAVVATSELIRGIWNARVRVRAVIAGSENNALRRAGAEVATVRSTR